MHGTTAGVRTPGGVPGPQRQEVDPAWKPFVRLLEIVVESAQDPAWRAAAPMAVAQGEGPLLHGSTLRPDAARLRTLAGALLDAAAGNGEGGASLAGLEPEALDVLELVRAAATHDGDAIERVAVSAEVDAAALGVVAQLLAVPVLHACASHLWGAVPKTWDRGYCPICGAWPSLVEVRGIERTRFLRCGCCAAAWQIPVLRCPFCDETNHEQLGSLLPEGMEQVRRVDICRTCNGYVKSFATLRPLSLQTLLMSDVTTVELDLAAQERGYARPTERAQPLELDVLDGGAPRGEAA